MGFHTHFNHVCMKSSQGTGPDMGGGLDITRDHTSLDFCHLLSRSQVCAQPTASNHTLNCPSYRFRLRSLLPTYSTKLDNPLHRVFIRFHQAPHVIVPSLHLG